MRDSRFFNDKADEMLRAATAAFTSLERTSYMQISAAWRELAVSAAEIEGGTPRLDGQIVPRDRADPPKR